MLLPFYATSLTAHSNHDGDPRRSYSQALLAIARVMSRNRIHFRLRLGPQLSPIFRSSLGQRRIWEDCDIMCLGGWQYGALCEIAPQLSRFRARNCVMGDPAGWYRFFLWFRWGGLLIAVPPRSYRIRIELQLRTFPSLRYALSDVVFVSDSLFSFLHVLIHHAGARSSRRYGGPRAARSGR